MTHFLFSSARAPLGARAALTAALLAVSSLGATSALAVDVKVTLNGDQEVPAVKTIGVGSGFFAISNDRKVSGQVNVINIKGVAAHVHEGAPGVSGPIVFPLVKSGETSYAVPPNVMLTEAQLAAFQAGKLYVNVHTDAHPGGEVRGQLKP
jgi:hypothetical protein